MVTRMIVSPNELNSVMDFDRVIEIHENGELEFRDDLFAPDLYDGFLETEDEWELMDGYSGQYGYSGPLMHQSEFVGGGLARYILETPGIYVALVNLPTADDEATEWAVARKVK